jgi:hypothetical protein
MEFAGLQQLYHPLDDTIVCVVLIGVYQVAQTGLV